MNVEAVAAAIELIESTDAPTADAATCEELTVQLGIVRQWIEASELGILDRLMATLPEHCHTGVRRMRA